MFGLVRKSFYLFIKDYPFVYGTLLRGSAKNVRGKKVTENIRCSIKIKLASIGMFGKLFLTNTRTHRKHNEWIIRKRICVSSICVCIHNTCIMIIATKLKLLVYSVCRERLRTKKCKILFGGILYFLAHIFCSICLMMHTIVCTYIYAGYLYLWLQKKNKWILQSPFGKEEIVMQNRYNSGEALRIK